MIVGRSVRLVEILEKNIHHCIYSGERNIYLNIYVTYYCTPITAFISASIEFTNSLYSTDIVCSHDNCIAFAIHLYFMVTFC